MTTLADDTGRDTAPPSQRASKARLSDRARAERTLGWKLAGPAFIIMLAVTAYPIINALWLSLYNYRLTDPNARSFVFLRNYVVILTDSLWWAAVGITVIITLVTVAVEFVLGMALAMVMNKIVIPRRSLRTIILIPYAIITVVSAFSWKYAFAVDSGYANHWLHTATFGAFPLTYDWFGGTWSSLAIICLSEIWKTTPFMSLLLLAGLAQVDRRPRRGSQGRRRDVLAAAVQGHPAEHEGGDHGGAAVPDARRVPDLRQRLHHDRRLAEHLDRLAGGLQPDHQSRRDRDGLSGVGAAVPHGAWGSAWSS